MCSDNTGMNGASTTDPTSTMMDEAQLGLALTLSCHRLEWGRGPDDCAVVGGCLDD
jgi:hypothetical protein